MHKMLSFITEHYTENITLTSMAEHLGYEPHYLSRCFHRAFDKNFKEFVNEYRIARASELLNKADGDISITDIAYQSGFQSVRSFNRVYKNSLGKEPRRIKKG